jgi:osmotically-inducible protein OsmY
MPSGAQMYIVQTTTTNPDGFSRCEERSQTTIPEKSRTEIQRADMAVKDSIYHAFWKDDILRAIEYDQIDVHVKDGVVHLTGHIVNTSSQIRIMNALRTVPGIGVIHNNLVVDDKLTLEVAGALGELEHTYDCKFFTGASHGVLSLNGSVRTEDIKTLAEKYAANNPNVRGVINNVRVSGSEPGLPVEPFLQPTIGEIIYFLDWISGVVQQVIIDPNNRRVIAMTIRGNFIEQPDRHNSMTDVVSRPSEQLIIVPMNSVRYLTKTSGFLHINSNERSRYSNFDPASFSTPGWDWVPPYPYCPADVLFPVEQPAVRHSTLLQQVQVPFEIASKEQLLWEQLTNDSLGG